MLTRGDAVPHFTVHGLDGTPVAYLDIWQQRNLVLAVLGDPAPSDEADAWVREGASYADEFSRLEATVVITRDVVAGLPAPAVLVADRWGEIAVAASGPDALSRLSALEALEWLRFVSHACPECEGEAL